MISSTLSDRAAGTGNLGSMSGAPAGAAGCGFAEWKIMRPRKPDFLGCGSWGIETAARNYFGKAAQELFLPVFLGVSLHGLFTVISRVSCVCPRCMRMVCGLLVMSALMVLSRFGVVAGSLCMMFRCLLVVFGRFL
jgi:hypothetical protein